MSKLFKRILNFLFPNQSSLEKKLRAVSITGRVAYCTSCLEIIFAIEKLHEPELEALLTCLWNFISNPDLSDWERNILDFLPEDNTEDSTWEQNHLSQQQAENLKRIYSSLPANVLDCIDSTIEVGRGNLYGGLVGYSKNTLNPAMQVLRYMLCQGYPLPTIDNFLRSPFSEQNMHGWGKRVDQSFFR